jgi:hypothetical protein
MTDMEIDNSPVNKDVDDGKKKEKKRFELKKVRAFVAHNVTDDSSGTLLPCGLGTLLLIIVPFVEITSWNCVRISHAMDVRRRILLCSEGRVTLRRLANAINRH